MNNDSAQPKGEKSDNELIAEFMGFEKLPNTDKWWARYITGLLDPYHGPHRAIHLRFDSSWDWLMPVVERIELLSLNFIIETACVRIQCFDDAYPVFDKDFTFESQEDTKINVCFRAVVEFIRWYNSNHPQP